MTTGSDDLSVDKCSDVGSRLQLILQLPPKLRAWGIVADCRRRRIRPCLRLRQAGQEASWTGSDDPGQKEFCPGGRFEQGMD